MKELAIPGVFEMTPQQFVDDRGVFVELFRSEPFTRAVGHELPLAQVNCSVSRRGVVRGIHFAQVGLYPANGFGGPPARLRGQQVGGKP